MLLLLLLGVNKSMKLLELVETFQLMLPCDPLWELGGLVWVGLGWFAADVTHLVGRAASPPAETPP